MQLNRKCVSSILTCSLLLGGIGTYLFSQSSETVVRSEERPASQTVAETRPVAPRFELSEVNFTPSLPPALLKKTTLNWEAFSLEQVVEALEKLIDLPVQVNQEELEEVAAAWSETGISERLQNQPLYLLLDRLQRYDIGWYLDQEAVILTSLKKAEEHLETRVFPVDATTTWLNRSQDLFISYSFVEALYYASDLLWMARDGDGGSAQLLRNALVVRHHLEGLRYTECFLAALQSEERFVLVSPYPEDVTAWRALEQKVAVDFQNVPFIQACQQLAEFSGLDIRVNAEAFKERGIDPQKPITLQTSNLTLSQLIRHFHHAGIPNAHYFIRQGTVWIVTENEIHDEKQTAIFNIPELSDEQSAELIATLISASSGYCMDLDGVGGSLCEDSAGKLIVRQTVAEIQQVQQVIQNLYDVWWSSADQSAVPSPDEMVIRYYRLEAEMATSVQERLRQLAPHESWRSPENPTGGEIALFRSKSQPLDSPQYISAPRGNADTYVVLNTQIAVPMSTLEIKQTARVHERIQHFLKQIQTGDLSVFRLGFGAPHAGSGFTE